MLWFSTARQGNLSEIALAELNLTVSFFVFFVFFNPLRFSWCHMQAIFYQHLPYKDLGLLKPVIFPGFNL